MRSFSATIMVFTVAFFVSGCSSGKSPMQEQIDALKDATDILATVKDKTSAQAALHKLQPITDRLRDLRKKQAKLIENGHLDTATAEENKRLTAALASYTVETNRLNKTKVEGAGDLIWLLTTAMAGLHAEAK